MSTQDGTLTEINLTKIKEPKFISLVGQPANQVAFKVIRKDNGSDVVRRHRARRSEALLAFAFEEGLTEEEVKAFAEEFGLEGYKIMESEGQYMVMRSDITDIPEDAAKVTLAGGRTAYVVKPAGAALSALTVNAIRFAGDYFTEDEAKAWLTKNAIDFSSIAVENDGVSVVAQRSEVPKDTEFRSVVVDDGVSFTITRSATQDVPVGYVQVINDTAFGGYGWGHLDFMAVLADVEFSEAARDGLRYLEDVLYNIMFYNDLAPSVKKTLVEQATGSFAEYVGTLLDALPARVVIANRSDRKEKYMSEKKLENAGTTEATPATTVAATPETKPEASAAVITREDVAAMITEAVGGVNAELAKLTAALATRSEAPADGAKPEGEADKGETKADPTTEALQQIIRSVAEVGTSVKEMGERVVKLESTTTVRSDTSDGTQTVKKSDVFAGAIFGAKKSAE